jgi:hypothetical protein
MSDITYCRGKGCKYKLGCKRFIEIPKKGMYSFAEFCYNSKKSTICGFFIPRERENDTKKSNAI